MQLVRYSDTKIALGGSATLTVVAEFDRDTAMRLFTTLWKDIFYFEKKFSRFLPNSEITKINKKAGTRVAISPAMHGMLTTTLHWANKTKDLFNPFVLPTLQRAGYLHSALPDYLDMPVPDYTDRHVVESNQLQVGDSWAEIPYGTAIDLGGIGKGYLLDQLSEKLREVDGVSGYWLELSGDIVTYGYDEDGGVIGVGIQNASDIEKKRTDYMVVGDGGNIAIATSGTFKRAAHDSSDIKHHIIDPRTGEPVRTDILLATVCAESATAADVLASCALIETSSSAPSFLSRHHIPSWMLQYKGTNNKLMVEVYGDYIRGVEDA